jgi:2'-5' RNA ligase
VRAFIAIDLPESLQSALAQKQATFRAYSPDARWTRPDGLHLTLKFLGQISDEQLRQVTSALAALGSFEKFTGEVKAFGFFPDARRARVLWAGVEAPPALAQLAKRVEDGMESLGFPAEARPFTPHLTLARFKTPRPQSALQAFIEKDREPSLGRFEVSEFFLFESKLSPHGAEYRKIARFPAL